MAKYRITSIPQSLPKNQFGGLFKKRKKKDNSIINYTPPSEETMVQGIEPQNGLGYMFGYPDSPTIEQFPTYNIGPQDYSRARTPEEVANTFAQPFNWTQGETIPAYDYTYRQAVNPLRNPIAERAYKYSLQRKVGIPYSGFAKEENTIQIPEKFIPDYNVALTETGDPLSCGEGKIPYKGQCITKEAYEIILQRERDQEEFTYQKEKEEEQNKFNLEINELKRKNREQSNKFYDDDIRKFFINYSKTKKQDKVEPFQKVPSYELDYMVPVLDENKQPVIDKKTGKPLMETAENRLKKSFLLNKKDGFTSMYPIEAVYDRINNSGFFNNEFEQYWGLDPKQVKEQLGDLQKAVKSKYNTTIFNKIMDKSLDKGISPDEAAGTLSKKLGYTENFKKDHAVKVQEKQNEIYNNYVNNTLKDLAKEIGVTVDKEGVSSYDFSKKDKKQNINFDFWSDYFTDTFDEDGVLIDRKFDPVGNYAKAWINAAPNEKEKTKRRNQVNAILNKDYSSEGNKAYEAELNKKFSVYRGDPFKGMNHLQINTMYGDQMQTVKSAQADLWNNKAKYDAVGASAQAKQAKRDEELSKLTGFDKDLAIFMQNNNRANIYDVYRDALLDDEITTKEKSKVLKSLKDNKLEDAMDIIMNRRNTLGIVDINKENPWMVPTYEDRLNNILDYGKLLEKDRVLKSMDVATGVPKSSSIGFGTKFWDCITNPDDCLYYGMNGRGESMWGNSNLSYNERKELERKYGIDAGTRKGLDPMTFPLTLVNYINPANYADEMYRGYQSDGIRGASKRFSDLNYDAAALAASFIPGGLGLTLEANALKLARAARALNAAKNTGTILNRFGNLGSRTLNAAMRGFNSLERGLYGLGYPGQYLVNSARTAAIPFALDAIRPYGDFHTGFNNLSEGNYWEGTKDIAEGALFTAPLLKRIPLSYQTPGGKTFNLGTALPKLTPGLQSTASAKTFEELIKSQPGFKKDYIRLSAQMHPDKFAQYGPEAFSKANKNYVNLQNIVQGDQFRTIPFTNNGAIQFGRLMPKYSFDMGRFGKLNYGRDVFKPMTLQQLATGIPVKNAPTNKPIMKLLGPSGLPKRTIDTKTGIPYLGPLSSQEDAVRARAQRMLSQENKWLGQNNAELKEKFENAHLRHNPAGNISAGKLGVNTGYGTSVSKYLDDMSDANKARVAAHETGHYYRNAVDEANEWNSFFDFSKLKPKTRQYLSGNKRAWRAVYPNQSKPKNKLEIDISTEEGVPGGNEIRERAAQLKDYIAEKNGIPLNQDFIVTEAQLDDAIANYVKDTGLDNSMSAMLSSLVDKKGFLNAINKYALGVAGATVIGNQLLPEKKQGGATGNSIIDSLRQLGYQKKIVPNTTFQSYDEGGSTEAFLNEQGELVCPDGYTYNSKTGYCEKASPCPEGYVLDKSTGKCKSEKYITQPVLYDWNDMKPVQVKDLKKDMPDWPEGKKLKFSDFNRGDVSGGDYIKPIKQLYFKAPGLYTDIPIYPELNYKVEVDPNKPEGFDKSTNTYYVKSKNNHQYEKYRQWQILKQEEKENLENIKNSSFKLTNIGLFEPDNEFDLLMDIDDSGNYLNITGRDKGDKYFLDVMNESINKNKQLQELYNDPEYIPEDIKKLSFDQYNTDRITANKSWKPCPGCTFIHGASYEINPDYDRYQRLDDYSKVYDYNDLEKYRNVNKDEEPYNVKLENIYDYVDQDIEKVLPYDEDISEPIAPEYEMPGYEYYHPYVSVFSPHQNAYAKWWTKPFRYKYNIENTIKTKPLAKLIQNRTGYDMKKMEGYKNEEGIYIPGEFEKAREANRRVRFTGANSIRDIKRQKEYNQAYDQYEKDIKDYNDYRNFMQNQMSLGKTYWEALEEFKQKTDNSLSLKLTQDEIEKYIQGGYIVEDE